MRVHDRPLPGDLVIRRREDPTARPSRDVFIITIWPDIERLIGGPYQSYSYAVQQARGRLTDRSLLVWLNHAAPNEPEELEDVTTDHG